MTDTTPPPGLPSGQGPSGPRLQAVATRIQGRAADGRWRVAGQLVVPAALILADRAQSLGPQTLGSLGVHLLPEDLGGADLLLLGTGERLARPPHALVTALRQRGLRLEAMDSAAAARTFNILAAENRPIAALLL